MDKLEYEDLLEIANRLAVSVLLLAHDAHPIYSNTAGWRGGIAGSAITGGCSIIDPPPDAEWTQYDLPTSEARKWLQKHPIDIDKYKEDLIKEWTDWKDK